jgi:glycerol-3-phosphate dehydrogenase (NAD(P)+)
MNRIAVIGAGSWGTALANLLAKKGVDTILWSFEAEVAEAIRREHRNPTYLSEIVLDPSLRVTESIAEAAEGAEVVVSVSPSHVVRTVMQQVAPFIGADTLLVSASKGIEEDSLETMDGVLAEVVGESAVGRMAFLSGPSFALEVALEHPTAVTMASRDPETARVAQELFQTDYFRVYTNPDVPGVELGGALKNVIAIAAGAVDGLGFGHNTRAALITRGLAEITRLGVSLGADPLTFAGLAGMGDLILTCTGPLSRNHAVGVELGRGRAIGDILAGMSMVAEGVRTAKAARALAVREGIEMPIVEEVYALLYENRAPREAVENLMLRSPKAEQWS